MSSAGLRAANAWLHGAAQQSPRIIVDEVGPLELAGGGLSPGLRAVLASPLGGRLYIVIRSDCLQAACGRFGISDYALVDLGSGEA
jgi:nucleoside-triphosphatase THEP1